MTPNDPTPSDRAPQQSAPFSMPSPFPAPTRRQRAKGATVWTAVGFVLAAALEWFLASRGVPAPIVAPIVEGAERVFHDVLPK